MHSEGRFQARGWGLDIRREGRKPTRGKRRAWGFLRGERLRRGSGFWNGEMRGFLEWERRRNGLGRGIALMELFER
jgi:hypothetical protein